MLPPRRVTLFAVVAFLLAIGPASSSARAQLNRWLELDGDPLKDPHVGVRVNLSNAGGKFISVGLAKRSDIARARYVGSKGEVDLAGRLREQDLRLVELPIEVWNDSPGWVAVDWALTEWEWPAARWRQFLATEMLLDRIRPDEKPVRLRKVNFYKLLVQRGGGTSAAVTKPVGQGLEIVPITDPLGSSNMVPVRVLLRGAPAPNVRVVAQLMEGFGGSSAKTDSEGKATLALDGRGAWVLGAVVVTDKEGGLQEVMTSAVTFHRR